MPVVTALQASPRGQVAVSVDGESICTITVAAVARWRLFKGRVLSGDEVSELCAAAAADRALIDARRLLAHRARAGGELCDRLLQKGHGEDAVAVAVAQLTGEGLIDDRAFTRAYVMAKRGGAGWGEHRIRQGLSRLGVDADLIEAALAESFVSEGDAVEDALRILRRRGSPQPPPDAERRRAYQLLLRRGFPGGVAYTAIKRWSQGDSEPRSD